MKILLLLIVLFSTSVFAQASCKNGDFLFSDFSCGNSQNNKTIIGVVADNMKQIAVSLTDSQKRWSILAEDIEVNSPQGLFLSQDAALQSFGGQDIATTFNDIAPNFYKAVNYCSSLNYVNNRAWFLPELGLLNLIYQNKYIINNSLQSVARANPIMDSFYWSGSQYNYSQSWGQNMFNGNIGYQNNNQLHLVRCVINY